MVCKMGGKWPYSILVTLPCRAISTDIPDPFSPPLPIVHRFRQVLRASSHIYTELLYVGSSWVPYLCSFMWKGPQEYITYELLLQQCPACLVRLILIVFEVGGRTAAALWSVASRTCSILLAVFLCSFRQAFSPSV